MAQPNQKIAKAPHLTCCQAMRESIKRGEIEDYEGHWQVTASDGVFRIPLEICPFCRAKIPRAVD